MTVAEPTPTDGNTMGDRFSRVTEAFQRVAAKTGLAEILQTVVDEARSITGAQYSAIKLNYAAGLSMDIITSGVSPQEATPSTSLPPGNQQSGRGDDAPKSHSAGDNHSPNLPQNQSESSTPLLARLETPITHWGETYGVISLVGENVDGAFSSEDSAIINMLSSLAGASITSALRYWTESRAAADLEALINTAPVGIMVFDAQTGALHSANEKIRQLREELRISNLPWDQLFHTLKYRRSDGREISLAETSLRHLLSRGETVRAEEFDIEFPGGAVLTALISATPVRSEDDRVVSVIVTLQDANPTENTHQLGVELLGTVSEELRTPLTTIKGSAATVLGASPPLDPTETRQFFRIIDRQADYMREIINNLLDLSHIEAGTLTISPVPSELRDILLEAREALLSSGAKYEVVIQQGPDLPLVWADRHRVTHVLHSLVALAARYSGEAPSVNINARWEELFIAVSIEVKRKGGSSEVRPPEFGYLTRIEGDQEVQALGPNFAVCRAIVESHGGRLWADFETGVAAARFTFTLPVADSPAHETKIGRSVGPSAHGATRSQGLPVLAIDRDPQVLRSLQHALEEAGYNPTVACDLNEVDSLMESARPQLLLLDLTLPGVQEEGIIDRITKALDIPVIFLSERGREQDISKAFELGADDYIVKPFVPSELLARVKAALQKGATYRLARPVEPFRLDDLTLDYSSRIVTVAGQPVQLTATEYKLLFELSVVAGRVLTHEQLLRRVWGANYSGDARIVRAFVKSLRRKLGDDASHPRYICTEPRVGYRMAKPNP